MTDIIRTSPSYRWIVGASGLANFGDGIRRAALPLMAAVITQNPLLVGGMSACAFLAWILLSLPIGALVDRSRPEVFMLCAGIARAVLMGGLAVALLADVRSLILLYAMAFLLGVGEAAFDNASQSLVPRVVADQTLEKANSSLVSVDRLGQDLLGPAVGGAVFALSFALPFGLSAVAMVLGALLVVGFRTIKPSTVDRPTPGVVIKEAAAGMRWLWRFGFVRTVVLTGAGLTFFTQTWESMLVLLATGPGGATAFGFGVILAVGAVGGIVGALITPALSRRVDRRRLQIMALSLAAGADLALAAVPHPIMAALSLAVVSVGFAIWNVQSVTLRQRLVPADMLGRVNAASRTMSMTAAALGALTGGAIAAGLGLTAPLWLSGAALLALAVLFARASRVSRVGSGAA